MVQRSARSTAPWLIAAASISLALTGCAGDSGSGEQGGSDDAVATANAATAPESCAAFPASDIPPTPTPPYNPPFGDPQQPESLQALQAAVVKAAQDPGYSKDGVFCAEGMNTPQECDVDYWNTGQTPGTKEQCNFFYLRVGNEYWSNGNGLGLTPLVLSQYSGYLGVSADGKDQENQEAGPHTTIAEYDGSWVNVGERGTPAATFTVTDGKLSAADVAANLQKAVLNPVTSSDTAVISPILAANAMTIDCSAISINNRGTWTQSTVDQVDPTTNTSFACTGTGPGVGMAFVEAALLPGAQPGDTVPAAVSVRASSDQRNTLRSNPSGQFTSDNVVWPTGLDEVREGTSIPFSIPTDDSCTDSSGGKSSSCLHLWVNFPSKAELTTGPQVIPNDNQAGGTVSSGGGQLACTIWFTLELDSPQLLQTMTRYGLSTTNYTPHISLAKKKWYTDQIGAPTGTAVGKPDPCNDARLIASGQPGADPFNPNP